MTFTLASVNPVSDIVGILAARMESSGRQRPELHTTRSKQVGPMTYCSEGFYVLLVIHIFVFEVRKANGNLLWTLGQEGGTSIIDHKGANFYPLSCVMYYLAASTVSFYLASSNSEMDLKVVQNINNDKKTYRGQSKELRFNQKLCKGIRFNEYGNYTAVAKSKRKTLNEDNKLLSDLRIPPLSQTSNYYPQTTNLGEGQ
jgi:hypothetical protein